MTGNGRLLGEVGRVGLRQAELAQRGGVPAAFALGLIKVAVGVGQLGRGGERFGNEVIGRRIAGHFGNGTTGEAGAIARVQEFRRSFCFCGCRWRNFPRC